MNSNTVLRALRTLHNEGLLEFRRGRGITVAGDAPTKGVFIARSQELVKLAQRYGYDRDELVQLIDGIA